MEDFVRDISMCGVCERCSFFQPKVEEAVFAKVLGLGLDWRVLHDLRRQR